MFLHVSNKLKNAKSTILWIVLMNWHAKGIILQDLWKIYIDFCIDSLCLVAKSYGPYRPIDMENVEWLRFKWNIKF